MKWPELPQRVIDFGKGYKDGYEGNYNRLLGTDYLNGYRAGAYDKLNDTDFQPEMWWGFEAGEGEEYDNRRKIKT